MNDTICENIRKNCVEIQSIIYDSGNQITQLRRGQVVWGANHFVNL